MKNWSKYLATSTVIGILVMAITGSVIFARVHEAGPWIDTTEAIAEQSAGAAGRQAAEPFINTDQGNMLVFFFTLAGVMAGTVIGYYWRKLIIDKDKEAKKQLNKMFFVGVLMAAALLIFAGYEAFSEEPFMNPGLGDVKLFTFISLGTITGFVVGYQWKPFSIRKKDQADGS